MAKLGFLRKFREVVLAPRALDYRVQFCSPTGANAVEAALKLARKATGGRTIVAFTNAYHGASVGALAASANPRMHAAAGTPLDGIVRMPSENYLGAAVDALSFFEAMLRPGSGVERHAAIVVETVKAEGGINVASDDWLRRLAALARRSGILLIVDDMQVGCGRTGTFFSFERAGLMPDIVCVSKAVGGIGMPMALTLIRPDLDVWRPGEHTGSFRGNNLGFNLGFVAGAAALDYWTDTTWEDALGRPATCMRERLEALAGRYPQFCVEVRGRGMIQGFACVDGRQAAAPADRFWTRPPGRNLRGRRGLEAPSTRTCSRKDLRSYQRRSKKWLRIQEGVMQRSTEFSHRPRRH